MANDQDYKRAYDRQRLAREKAESLLEVRSRELYDANQTLQNAYDKLNDQKNQLVQQEKLASIGLLAAGVAHEINNPVGFVKSNLQTLDDYSNTYAEAFITYRALADAIKEGNKEVTANILAKLDSLLERSNLEFIARDGQDCIAESLVGIERVEEIIVNLSDFARSEGDDRVKCNINELLESTLKLVWNEIKYKCEIEKNFGAIPEIYGWQGQLRQVFVNIVVNAAQAIEDKGTLQINTYSDDKNVIIEFVDEGPGIDKKIVGKLFDPFFTTKDVGSGTGLGLYVSHGIIKKHHGKIEARNNKDRGACFTVTLPIEVRTNR